MVVPCARAADSEMSGVRVMQLLLLTSAAPCFARALVVVTNYQSHLSSITDTIVVSHLLFDLIMCSA